MATKNLSEYNAQQVPDASNMTFGVVVAEWNPEITRALLDGCVSTLEKHGALPENIHVKTVPGSFELIYGAHQMTLNDGYDAVIILQDGQVLIRDFILAPSDRRCYRLRWAASLL